jgi:hypothetical protein
MKAEAGDRRNEVSIIARGLKEVAKDENIRIICLSQLSRLAEDGNPPVKLHHLKESGDIEESADIVTGQWKTKSKKCQNIATLKLRNGGFEGQFLLMTDGTYFRTPTTQEINFYGTH